MKEMILSYLAMYGKKMLQELGAYGLNLSFNLVFLDNLGKILSIIVTLLLIFLYSLRIEEYFRNRKKD